jgi:hypothetical protein
LAIPGYRYYPVAASAGLAAGVAGLVAVVELVVVVEFAVVVVVDDVGVEPAVAAAAVVRPPSVGLGFF